MKRIIAIIGILSVLGMSAASYYWGQAPVKGVAATLTDTIGPFTADDYNEIYLWSYLDLTSSTTITMTVTVMAKTKDGLFKDISAAKTIASGITADDDDLKTQLRSGDSTILMAPVFWLKRVTTVTGDSVTIRQSVFGK